MDQGLDVKRLREDFPALHRPGSEWASADLLR